MLNFILDEEEQAILDAFDADEIQPIPDASKEIEKHRQYAAATLINPRKQPHE